MDVLEALEDMVGATLELLEDDVTLSGGATLEVLEALLEEVELEVVLDESEELVTTVEVVVVITVVVAVAVLVVWQIGAIKHLCK